MSNFLFFFLAHLSILTTATVNVDEATIKIRIKYMYLFEVLAAVVVVYITFVVTLGVVTAVLTTFFFPAGRGGVLLEMELEPPVLVDPLTFTDVY